MFPIDAGSGNRIIVVRVVIRVDATGSIGTGHVMRCWALAEEFTSRGAEVHWQGTLSVPWLQAAFRQKRWRFGTPQQPDCVEADLVVVDSYTQPLDYRQSLVDRGIQVLAIVDDYHRELGPGTVWVNPGAPTTQSTESNFLNGPDYILIRQEVRELRQLRDEVGSDDAITFLLGGTDYAGIQPAINSLDLPGPVFAGPGFGSDSRVTWIPGGSELLQRAATSRVVVSAAGVSSWEMLHVGVPLVLFVAVENQQGNYKWMTSRGWALGLGSKPRDLKNLADALEVQGSSQTHVDGLGAKRVADVVMKVC